MSNADSLMAEGGEAGRPTLLERESQLAAVNDVLTSAAESHGGLLIAEAPPGLGKTTLLKAVAQSAADRNFCVLEARGHELEQGLSFGVAVQLFERVLAEAGEEKRAQLLEGAAALAAPLFPAYAGEASATTDGELMPRLHGLHWLASNIAERSPLLIAIDDAHWADSPSLRFVVYAAQRITELPVALVIAVRPSGFDNDGLVEHLRSHDAARVVALHELSAEGAAVAIRRVPGFEGSDDGFSMACFEVTRGNPFLLNALLSQLMQDRVEPAAEQADRVRRMHADAVMRSLLLRLGQLPAEAAGIARAVAVLETEATVDRAAALAGVDLETAVRATTALEAADILQPGDRPRFVHAIVRSSIYADLNAAQRSALHFQAARMLEDEGAPVEVVATHVLHATPSGQRWALEVLSRAADAALSHGDPVNAARYLRRALQESPDRPERVSLLGRLGAAEMQAGTDADADHLREAVALSDSPRQRGEMLLSLGQAHLMHGHHVEAVKAFDRGLAEVGDADPDLALRMEASRLRAATLDRSLAPSALERVKPVLRRTELGSVPRDAERPILAAAAFLGAYSGDQTCDRVSAIVDWALGEGQLLEMESSDGSAIYLATAALLACDELEREEEVLSAAVADARRRGSVTGFASASALRAGCRLFQGKLVEAIADAEQAIDARRYGWEELLPAAYGYLLSALVERADLAGARAMIESFDDEGFADKTTYGLALAGRGRLHLAEGRFEEAVDDFLAWGRQVPDVNPALASLWRSQAAIALTMLGRNAEAVELARDELALGRRFGSARAIGASLRALGRAEGGEAGLGHLREAEDVLASSQSRLEHCRALVDLGAAQRRAGKVSEARETLRRALDLAERLGATARGNRAREELKMAGARTRRTALSGVDSLTPAELRVARMAAEGMTNREIAESLFVTVKAVEWHLRNAYPKLGISSRRDLGGVLQAEAAGSVPGG